MNEREAARVIDYGRTRVTARTPTGQVAGVAVKIEMVPMLTVRLDDGSEVSCRLEDVAAG